MMMNRALMYANRVAVRLASLTDSTWQAPLLFAVMASALVLGLFWSWFVVANRYVIFLYYHLGTTPFDEFTRSRYWMAGLVAAGCLTVVYAALNWVAGRFAMTFYHVYRPPDWRKIWLLSAWPIGLGIVLITANFNTPTLSATDIAHCVLATLSGLGAALWLGTYPAQVPARFMWLVLQAMGLALGLLLFRLIELPIKGQLRPEIAYALSLGSLVAGIVVAMSMRVLHRKFAHEAPIRAGELVIGTVALSYLVLPLFHYLVLTPPEFRYISAASNFFAASPVVQLGSCLTLLIMAFGLAKYL